MRQMRETLTEMLAHAGIHNPTDRYIAFNRKEEFQYCVACFLYVSDDIEAIETSLHRFYTNDYLKELEDGKDYRWMSGQCLGFRSEDDRQIFQLFL